MPLAVQVADFCVQYLFSALFFCHYYVDLQIYEEEVVVYLLTNSKYMRLLFEILMKGKLVLLKKGTCQMFEDGIFMHNFNFLFFLWNTRVPDVSHLKLGPNRCHFSILSVDLFYIFLCFTAVLSCRSKNVHSSWLVAILGH